MGRPVGGSSGTKHPMLVNDPVGAGPTGESVQPTAVPKITATMEMTRFMARFAFVTTAATVHGFSTT
jgi:hypothetical protein